MSARDLVGVDVAGGRPSETFVAVVHRSPAVPNELHLGPAADCPVCNPPPPPRPPRSWALAAAAGVLLGVVLGALLWALILWALL